MKLPTERITITVHQYQLLKPGLDLLSSGLANAKLGLFPHRYPQHMTPLISGYLYNNQEFAPDMPDLIIAVRAKLWGTSKPRKLRLDMIELAAVQLALR